MLANDSSFSTCLVQAISHSLVHSYSMESVVYINIRVEREGMNLGILEGEMGFVANAIVHSTLADDKSPSAFRDAPSQVELV